MSRMRKEALKRARKACKEKIGQFTMRKGIPPCQVPAKVGNGAE